jgi:transcriptional regulator with XRE-family HTH domain
MTLGSGSDSSDVLDPVGRPDLIEAPGPVDRHVGRRLRLARLAMGWTCGELAGRLAIAARELEAFEEGALPVSAGRLHRLAAVFGVSIQYFFDGFTPPPNVSEGATPGCRVALAGSPESDPQLLRLVGAYHRIADEGLRAELVDLVARMPGGLTRDRRQVFRGPRRDSPLHAD